MTVNRTSRPINNRSRSQPKRRFLHKAPVSARSTSADLSKRSVYYWWWAYLRKNERYRRCCENGGTGRLARLYADFGDVFTVDFRKWWDTDRRGERLFAEPLAPVHLRELRSVDEWDADWTREGVLVVVVPLSESKRRIKSAFDRLLLRRHDGMPGVPTTLHSQAMYPVHTMFSAPALEQMLMVYDLRQEEPDLTLAEIGQRLKLVSSAMPKKGDTPKDAAARRNTMAATVSRYLKKADAMIRNAALGKFPCAD